MIELNIIFHKTEKKLKGMFKISSYFCFGIISLDQKNKQAISLCGPKAFMYYLIFIQLNQVLDSQKKFSNLESVILYFMYKSYAP